jgi:hypothetical protein
MDAFFNTRQICSAVLLFTAMLAASWSLHAQLYIGPSFTLYVQPGSELFIDSLVLKPNTQLALSDLNVSKSYTAINTPSGPTIKRNYTITAPINFSGEAGLYFDPSELNGNLPSSLAIAYESTAGGGFTVGAGGMVTPAINYVMLPLNTTTSLARVTAIGGGAPLSVSLLSYTAEAAGSKARLSWTTGNEQNNDYFEISRSTDGRNFSTIAKVGSKGNGNQAQDYMAWDEQPVTGTNYYRLSQYDLGGKLTRHGVRVLHFGEEAVDVLLTAWPNPIVDVLHLRFPAPPGDNAKIIVTDIQGKTILQQKWTGLQLSVDMHRLSTGIYFVRYSDSNMIRTLKIEKL